jgi:flagellar biosynthesis/type III secretory pathway protein FliH
VAEFPQNGVDFSRSPHSYGWSTKAPKKKLKGDSMKKLLTLAAAAIIFAGIGTVNAAENGTGGETETTVLKDGLKNGMTNGAKNGLANGAKNGLANGAKNGLANGAKNGLTQGMKNGLKDGLKKGLKKGLKNGKKK